MTTIINIKTTMITRIMTATAMTINNLNMATLIIIMNTIKEFENIIKVKFRDKKLLLQSLTHKSFSQSINNEKLEFLGDRVLGLVISEKLLEKYPNEKEGIIDKKFANLVNKKTCSQIAKKINLKKFILLGSSHKKLERYADKISSDCLEALVGAIYLDSELKSVKKFILMFWEEYLLKSTITSISGT